MKWLEANSITQSSKSIRLKSNLPAYPKTLVCPNSNPWRGNSAAPDFRHIITLHNKMEIECRYKRGIYKTGVL